MIDIKYKKIYDEFISFYKKVHVNPWHEISEQELKQLYDNLINSMDVNDEYSFSYFINYIIKRLSGKEDAHTKYDMVSLIPINFRIFGNVVLTNYPESLKNSKLLSINGVKISTIIQELEEVITYGTPGKRKIELEKHLFDRYLLFSLPSLKNFDKLCFELESMDGKRIIKTFDKEQEYSKKEIFNSCERYHFSQNTTYKFIDNCLIYNHSSIQIRFKDEIEQAINNLKGEDLSYIDTIIIDIRGNTGGNDTLNKFLMDFLLEHKDKKLICLTDYRVFSGGRYALRDLINLGAITIGEEISTPINCYGDSNWTNIDNHYFKVSECYFHPFFDFIASSKEEFQKKTTNEILAPYIFKPDILIEETKDDYIKGIDPILNYALEYSKSRTHRK